MIIGRLNGRDSSQLFLHELENKMLHLHETFFWLMTEIEELAGNRQCNRFSVFHMNFNGAVERVSVVTTQNFRPLKHGGCCLYLLWREPSRCVIVLVPPIHDICKDQMY